MSEGTARAAGGEGPFAADPLDRSAVAAVGLITLFVVVALATAQLTAAKVIALPLPVALPVVGPEIVLPGAALAYALTFLASDCYAELYGRRAAQVVVNVAFLANFLVLALVWSTLAAPGIDPEIAAAFDTALGPAANVVAGSLLAYVVSQNWDVVVFHAIRDRTGRGMLWLRNVASTASSQAIDTAIFVGVAFYAAPSCSAPGTRSRRASSSRSASASTSSNSRSPSSTPRSSTSSSAPSASSPGAGPLRFVRFDPPIRFRFRVRSSCSTRSRAPARARRAGPREPARTTRRRRGSGRAPRCAPPTSSRPPARSRGPPGTFPRRSGSPVVEAFEAGARVGRGASVLIAAIFPDHRPRCPPVVGTPRRGCAPPRSRGRAHERRLRVAGIDREPPDVPP